MSTSVAQTVLTSTTRRSTALFLLAGMMAGVLSPWTVQARPQSLPPLTQQVSPWITEIPANTLIPVSLTGQQDSLTLVKGENTALTLRTTSPLRSQDGTIVIPVGSDIVGQFRPIASGNGVQFVAQQVALRNGQVWPINAQSRELVGFTQRNRPASAADVIKGTLAGAGTATVIAGTTGDRRINALEVLGGAAFGALAGWGLPTAGIMGGQTQEVMTLSSRDLTLTLQSPLTFERSSTPNISPRSRILTRNTAW